MIRQITPGHDSGFLTFSKGLWDTRGFADCFLRILGCCQKDASKQQALRSGQEYICLCCGQCSAGWMGKMPAAAGSLAQPRHLPLPSSRPSPVSLAALIFSVPELMFHCRETTGRTSGNNRRSVGGGRKRRLLSTALGSPWVRVCGEGPRLGLAPEPSPRKSDQSGPPA